MPLWVSNLGGRTRTFTLRRWPDSGAGALDRTDSYANTSVAGLCAQYQLPFLPSFAISAALYSLLMMITLRFMAYYLVQLNGPGQAYTVIRPKYMPDFLGAIWEIAFFSQ